MYVLERTKFSKKFQSFLDFPNISEAPIIRHRDYSPSACRARSWGLAGKRAAYRRKPL